MKVHELIAKLEVMNMDHEVMYWDDNFNCFLPIKVVDEDYSDNRFIVVLDSQEEKG